MLFNNKILVALHEGFVSDLLDAEIFGGWE